MRLLGEFGKHPDIVPWHRISTTTISLGYAIAVAEQRIAEQGLTTRKGPGEHARYGRH